MRNLKKLLALVVVIAMALTLAMPVFAADAPKYSAEAQKLNAMGLYDGISTGSFDPDLGSTLDRQTGTTLLVKILGKKADAEALSDADVSAALVSFKDADKIATWAKKYVAFAIKSGMSKGLATDTFGPAELTNANQFATMIMRNLGFAVIDVNTGLTALKEKGGLTADQATAFAALTSFTKDSVVGIAFGALSAADSTGKKLIENLVAAKVVTEAAATAAGVYTSAKLDIDSVAAVTNTRVDVVLKTAAKAADAAKFAITDAAGATLAVSGATLSADGKTISLATAAQVPGALYKVAVEGATYEVVGLVKDATKPALNSALALTNTTVKVTFDNDDLANDSALNPANYTIAGLTVSGAAFYVDNDDNVVTSAVVLTTSAQTSGKLYEVKVTKVADKSGNVMDDTSKKFGGKAADTVKPAVKTVLATDNTKVTVTFTEAELLDAATANNAANYTLNNGLTVSAVELDATTNKLGLDKKVTLTTSAQTSGKLYSLTIKGIKDASGNVIDDTSKNFGGKAPDTSALNLVTALADSNTKVKLTFDDNVDTTLGANVANYTIDGLTISKAEVDSDDNSIVWLTTSAQVGGKLYDAKVANLKDDAGNALGTTTDKKFGGKAADTKAPEIQGVVALSNTSIKVTFTEKVDEKTAEILSNYSISELGYPTKAVLDDGGLFVTLDTAAQLAKVYTLTINNVTDTSGNKIAAASQKKFSGIGDALGMVKLESAYALDKATIKLVFNKALNAAAAVTKANYTITTETDSATNVGVKAGNKSLADAAYTGHTAIKLGGDDKEVTITFDGTICMNAAELYTITVSGITGKYGAVLDTDNDAQEFAGLGTDRADITVNMINQIDDKNIEVVFSEKVAGAPVANTFALYKDEGNIPATTNAAATLTGATATIDADDATKVDVHFNTALEAGTVYYLNIIAGNGLTDLSGLYGVKIDASADKSEGVFATATVEAPTLIVEGAAMTDVNTLVVYFNQNISVAAGFDPADVADQVLIKKGSTVVADHTKMKSYYSVDGKTLTLYFAALAGVASSDVLTVDFNAGQNNIRYAKDSTLTLAAAAADDQDYDFGYVDTENDTPYLLSAEAVADNIIKVTFSEAIKTLAETDLKVYNGDTAIADADVDVAFTDGDDFATITYTAGNFNAGTTYDIVVANASVATDMAGIGALDKATNVAGNKDNSVSVGGVHQ